MTSVIEGLTHDFYVEVDGETFRMQANGPSFYNGLGKWELRKVNWPWAMTGSIGRDGRIYVQGFSTDLTGGCAQSVEWWAAFGRAVDAAEFREVVASIIAMGCRDA